MKKNLLIGLSIFIIASVWLYSYLGGTEELIFETENVDLHFSGNRYQGAYNDPQLEQFFFEAKEKLSEYPEASLAVLNWEVGEPEQVDQLIGLAGKENYFPPADTSITISGQFVKASITSHNLVMPQPEEVLEQALEYAQEKNLQIDPQWTLEIYRGERALEVYFPLKD